MERKSILESAALLAVHLHLNSWDGTIFRMNIFSSANHACSSHGLSKDDRQLIIEAIEEHEQHQKGKA